MLNARSKIGTALAILNEHVISTCRHAPIVSLEGIGNGRTHRYSAAS